MSWSAGPTRSRARTGSGGKADPRIRVMFCTDSMDIGGTELNAIRTAELLDPERFDLGVVCLRKDGPLAERYAAAGIPLFHFPIPSLFATATFQQGVKLAALLRNRGVHVFHSHDRYSNIFGVPWARLAGVPGVIASRRWWRVQPRRGHRAANRIAYEFAHAVVANSPRVARLLQREEHVSPRRVKVVPNFLDRSAYNPLDPRTRLDLLTELGVPVDSPIVGIVANLRPVKDHETLLQATALLRSRWPSLRVVFVGEGQSRRGLEELAAQLNLTKVVCFAGRRPSHPNLHHLFDVSVLCSVSEALSNSILEAMAAGNPVVATEVGATADAVVNGKTGLLVPPGDPVRLSRAIESLLADPSRARAMGAAGLQRARERYSPEVALDALQSLYHGLIGPVAGDPLTAREAAPRNLQTPARAR